MSHHPSTSEHADDRSTESSQFGARRVELGPSEDVPEQSHEKAGIQGFFDQFAEALTSGNADIMANLWETPAFVIGEGVARAVSSPGDVAELFAGVVKQYEARNITATSPELLRLDWIGEDLVVVEVRWPYSNVDAEIIGEETSAYTLMRPPGGSFRIRAVLMRGAAD